MALRLEIISSQRQQLGSRASFVLGAVGGTLGRALDNDWALPDPQRYLSGHHARFHCRQGAYYLEDTSSNGVFVNDATTPQGRKGLYALHDGDILRMGEYRMRVHIEQDTDSVRTPGTHTMATMAVDDVSPLHTANPVTDDLGASLNIEALIPIDMTGPAAKLSVVRGEAAGSLASLSTEQRRTRLREAARARLEGGAAPVSAMRNGMQAFCNGAGIDASRLPMENEAQSLRLVGRLLREAIIGLKDILRAQQSFRDHHGIATEKPAQSPLEKGTDEYLLELLSGHERHQFDAVMLLRNCFTHASEHDAAVDPALLAALEQFLAHLSPARLESGSGGVSAEAGWKRYKDVYAHLLQTRGGAVPPLFAEAISQAYSDAQNTANSQKTKLR